MTLSHSAKVFKSKPQLHIAVSATPPGLTVDSRTINVKTVGKKQEPSVLAKALQESYSVIREFEEFDSILETAVASIVTRFAKDEDTKESALANKTIEQIESLREVVANRIHKAYDVLRIKDKSVLDTDPSAKSLVNRTEEAMARCAKFHALSNSQPRVLMYRSLSKAGTPDYVTYIEYSNVVTSTGFVYPHFYVVLSGDDIATLYDFKSPGTFSFSNHYSIAALDRIIKAQLGGIPVGHRRAIPYHVDPVNNKRDLSIYGITAKNFPRLSFQRLLHDKIYLQINLKPEEVVVKDDKVTVVAEMRKLAVDYFNNIAANMIGVLGKGSKAHISPLMQDYVRKLGKNGYAMVLEIVLAPAHGASKNMHLNSETIKNVARALGLSPEDLHLMMLDGPRYANVEKS